MVVLSFWPRNGQFQNLSGITGHKFGGQHHWVIFWPLTLRSILIGHSCFPCRTFYVGWTLLDKMSGKEWALCRTSAEVCRTCPAYFATTVEIYFFPRRPFEIYSLGDSNSFFPEEGLLKFIFSRTSTFKKTFSSISSGPTPRSLMVVP